MNAFALRQPKELFESQKLALWYFAVAILLFGVQIIFGLLIAYQYIDPEFLYGTLSFMTNRTLHVNSMIVWLLVGLMGGVYWFLPLETGREVVGIKLAKFIWWVIVAGVTVVVLVYTFVQVGPGNALPFGSSTKAANTSKLLVGPTSPSLPGWLYFSLTLSPPPWLHGELPVY